MNPELATALNSPVVPAFHGNNVIQMASHGSDKNLTVRFFVEAVYQQFESEKQGRAVYKDENYVHISAPGGKTDYICKVQMEDRMDVSSHPHRFPRQWQAFCDQQEQVPEGTPLEMCAFLSKSRVMELKASKIFTAEQYVALPDSTLQTLGMGALREKELCKAFLGSTDENIKQVSALQAENSAMKSDLEMMRQQIAALSLQTGQTIPQMQPVATEPVRVKRAYNRKPKETV